MDDSSPLPLISLCTSISSHAAAGASELRALIETLPFTLQRTQLHPLRANFRAFYSLVSVTEESLKVADVISDRFRQTLAQSLGLCNEALATLCGQLINLRTNTHIEDFSYVATYNALFTTYTQLLGQLIPIFSL